VPVEIGQAGGKVACSCGAQLDVPTLRQLRHLPRAGADDKPSGRAWGLRHGIVTACLIVVAGLLAWSAWVWWTEPVIPRFDAATRTAWMQSAEEHLKTPAGAWERWIIFYRPLAENGLRVFHIADVSTIQNKIDDHQFLRGTLWTVAGVFAVVAVAAAFWPDSEPAGKSRRTRRQGD
jgi:hypothetical protein